MDAAKQQVALVTGSSRGIGKAIALRLSTVGYKVAINYFSHPEDADGVVKTIEKHGGKAIAVRADVSKSDEVEAMFQQLSEFGEVDVLVNNAGIIKDSLLMRMPDETWDAVVNISLRGTFLCTRAALRAMVRNRWGRVVNIGSVVGMLGNPGQSNYAAAKAGMIGFTQSVAKEVASRNVTVNYIAPGYTTTDIVEGLPQQIKDRILARIPMQRFAKADEIANVVAFLVSDQAEYITGQTLTVDGGLSIS